MRPDGQGAELKVRELETVMAFSDLAATIAQNGVDCAEQAKAGIGSLSTEDIYRLLGRSQAYTEASRALAKLIDSFSQ